VAAGADRDRAAGARAGDATRVVDRRRILVGGLACLAAAAAPTFLNQSIAATLPSQAGKERRILIVYLSRTQNTRAVAQAIRRRVGGAMVELELSTPYPADYAATVKQVASENEQGILPPLKTRVSDIEVFDTVFLGFPTWGMQLPPPVKSFLSGVSLEGKSVIPFNTHAGYGVGNSFETVRELCPRSRVLKGFTTRGGVERDGQYLVIQGPRAKEVEKEVTRWLDGIGAASSPMRNTT
jgi:flavodoxin